MTWRIEIKDKPSVFDASGEGIRKDIEELGIKGIEKVSLTWVYTLEGDLARAHAERICRELLADQITQDYSLHQHSYPTVVSLPTNEHCVEIAYNLGVMDPVETSTLKGIRDLGITSVQSVRTAKQYLLKGKISNKDFNTIVDKVLSNKLIQHVVNYAKLRQQEEHQAGRSVVSAKDAERFDLVIVDLLKASSAQLMELSKKGQLFLNVNEMKAIQAHFRKLGRNPTDCELETIAQTWSEHCHHKTFRGHIRYQEKINGKVKVRQIKSLLKSTIVKATTTLNKPWCVSVFHDNAGVIAFDDESHVCFKVETHNHPSALEPFGGANTGLGGVIRDSLGTGLGAKPIANTDIFCFAKPDTPFSRLPAGTLHPLRVMKGVVAGVKDYGNKMGIPTVNGAVLFDDRFIGNPLVFCGNIGLIPKDKVAKKVSSGDLIVVVGGRTGRDGIHGATFSSGELTDESEVISSGAVQIGNPIEEKKILDVLLRARDENLYSAITDCGAGGLSSAIGEMGQHTGAKVHLDQVPLKYQGLKYMEIWISESQERMVLSVPPSKIKRFQELFARENAEATVLGEFTNTKRLEILYHGCQVCDLSMEFLHEGLPKITKEAVWAAPKLKDPRVPIPQDYNAALKEVLGHYNVCSKEWIIRQYDHEVQGASVIKPLSGVATDGPSDASVIRPRLGSHQGIAIANGINVRFGMIDPFWMAASCIDEAVRQIIAVGGDLKRIAILDNFCWGNPDKPDRLGSLVRCAQGCLKASLGYGVPFISGKDSLYNEFTEKGKSIAIPGTILISAIGIVADVRKCVTMDFKRPGNLIYVLGETKDELGGSIYLDNLGFLGTTVPQVDFKKGLKLLNGLQQAIERGWVRAAHDCSEGGLGVALAEMAFSGGVGAEVNLAKVHYSGKLRRDDYVLFSESNSRLVVEVTVDNQKEFETMLKGTTVSLIGRVSKDSRLQVMGLQGHNIIQSDLAELKSAWQKPLAY